MRRDGFFSRPTLGAAAATITVAAVAAWVVFSGRWVCPIFHVTGWYCPGCGGTRAVVHLLQGRPIESLQSNALLIPATLVAVLPQLSRNINDALNRHRTAVITAAVITTLAFVIARNTGAPWLAPS